MNICFLHSSMQAGGIERTIMLLSAYLANNNHNVSIITLDNEDSFYPLHKNVNHIKLNVSDNSTSFINAIFNNIKRVKAFRKEIKKEHFDAVVCFGTSTELIAILARGFKKYKVIGAERSNPFNASVSVWSKNKNRLAKKCDGFIFQTAGSSKYYDESVRKKGTVIQNGIDVEKFKQAEIPFEEKKGFCAVGRINKSKCFDELIEIFSNILEEYPNETLDIFGDGPEREKLENRVKENGLQNNILFRGKSKEIINEYAKHKFFIMTSKTEGFPNVLMEALASGCVCVSSNCDFGPSEMVIDGENGFLVKTHDKERFIEVICNIYNDYDVCKNVSSNAKKIRKTNDFNIIGELYEDYIRKVIRQ